MTDFEHTPSLAAEAYSVVRQRILRGELVLGQAIREALEVQAAMLFTRGATGAERGELRKLAARVDAVAVQPDRTLYTVLHHKLHRRIAECARCPMLGDAIEKTHALKVLTPYFKLRKSSGGIFFRSRKKQELHGIVFAPGRREVRYQND
jgi:DNA-binding GntR family transcriptional regulator